MLQSCLTLCNPIDCSLPGSYVHGILQARILEWVAMTFSCIFLTQGSNPHLLCLLHWQAGSLPLVPPGNPKVLVSHVRLFATPLTVACRAPLSMGFPRQEHWSEVPFPSPGDLPDPGIKLVSPVSSICRQILYHLSHQGRFSLSRGSS